ncbi:sigma-54 dependent transcriptional regulator [Proteiniphilum sp.]|uniref:sigma-54-dependent transcriptional regulator n=1 Tax=Proteiniphilum sp. TaxID=1926877 RepID=UPI002B1FF355|nr:sigma-54 dependent transcriptional regulator [Proteiniphilum sp.]MEA4917595.1 sigma-54 dependent transcriptional regulator [Proteiniphilum sp.]
MILIIDDDAIVRSSLSLLLKRAGYETEALASPEAALDFVRHTSPDLMLMDMNFSLTTKGEEGLELLQKVQVFCPTVPVILITAWGSISLAVRGMKAGAFDFITKPWDNRQLLSSIETALELRTRKTINGLPQTRRELDALYDFSSIIGQSEALINVLSTVARIANTNASVLITGESGTGKELIAEAIHKNSPRKKQQFVKVNLGGVSQSLFESEMFGHKKGAFTDAQADRTGRFELADKGTIFLDEIGELDTTCQVKLLRVLQDQTFEVLGDSTPRKVDVRVVSATNADLPQMVREKTFREDLFYRINLIQVHLPALRERKEDIPLLAQFFADRQSAQNRLAAISFTSDAFELLQTLPFPGNIRELKNLVERTILVSGKNRITADDLRGQTTIQEIVTPSATVQGMTLDTLEAQTIRNAIEQHNGNLSKAAKTLGISRTALYRRIEKYGL